MLFDTFMDFFISSPPGYNFAINYILFYLTIKKTPRVNSIKSQDVKSVKQGTLLKFEISAQVLKFEISAQVFVHKIPFFRYSASALKHSKFFDYCWLLFISNVTRLGDLLHFGQLFKARGNNYFPQIANTF